MIHWFYWTSITELNWLSLSKVYADNTYFSWQLLAHFLVQRSESRSNKIRCRIISWDGSFSLPPYFHLWRCHHLLSVCWPLPLANFSNLVPFFPPRSKHHAKLSRRHANWLIRFSWSIHRCRCVEHANELARGRSNAAEHTSDCWRNRLTNVSLESFEHALSPNLSFSSSLLLFRKGNRGLQFLLALIPLATKWKKDGKILAAQ